MTKLIYLSVESRWPAISLNAGSGAVGEGCGACDAISHAESTTERSRCYERKTEDGKTQK